MPLATTEKVALAPAVTELDAGCVVMSAGVMTVEVLLVTLPATLVTTT